MQDMLKITEYSNKKPKWIAIFILIIAISGFIAYIYLSPKQQEESFRYITEPLKKGNLTIMVPATGYIQPVEEVKVGSEVSGTIQKVFVDYNDIVKKGQIIAQIDKTKYQSALNKAKANLDSAKASLKNMQAKLYQAKTTIVRDRKLRKSTKGALPSQSDWDLNWSNYLSAKAQVEGAKAQVEQSKYTLISARYNLDRTTIYSPINGVILERNVDPGQTVAASFQTPVLFVIAKNLTKMELQASIDEADIATVKAGQNASFTVYAYPKKTFKTKIRIVYDNSKTVAGVVTYEAVMNVDNKELLLKPGMSANVNITTKTIKNSFIVPRSAMLFIPLKPGKKNIFGSHKKEKITINPKPHIWILKKNKPKRVYIKILGNSGSLTAITSNELKENDKVIIMQEKIK